MEARSAETIWEAALGELQLQVSKANYKTWLAGTVGLDLQDDQFTVGAPNTFVAEYLGQNQRSLIKKTLIGIIRRNVDIVFQVNGQHRSAPDGLSDREEEAARQYAPTKLNPRYTFDSFVVGGSNRLAYTAALGVTQDPGHSYNPLFIFGEVGMGKTHLLHAIGHAARASRIRVIYVTAERFTNEFITAVRERKTEEFRSTYRSTDMLLIDDLHFISGKRQTEESFFHTFNELHNANHQIVVTSHCPPKAMSQLQDQLRSRLEWGLVVKLRPPDTETRLAILQTKAKQKGVDISPDVMELIAQRAQQNVRELEGSLNRVVAYARLIQAPPTPEIASRALEDIAGKQPKAAPTMPELVLRAVASSFRLTPADLVSQKRDKETALARQVAMYLIRQTAGCSLTETGQFLGGKNPSTVSHACEKIAADITTNSYLKRKVSEIEQALRPGKEGAQLQ